MSYPSVPSGAVAGGASSKSYSWGTGKTKAYVKGTVAKTSGTVATVSVSGAVSCDSSYNLSGYGVKVSVYADGTSLGSTSTTFNGSAAWIGKTTKTKTFARKASDYTITIKTTYAGATVSGYSGCSNSGTVSTTVVIPKVDTVAPAAPTDLVNTRNSDTQNTLSWTNNSTSSAPYSNIVIMRSVNGADYTTLATLTTLVSTYIDNTTSANNYYTYQVKAVNSAGAAASEVSNTTYNTPTTIQSITGERTAANQIKLTITDTITKTATIQRVDISTDQETWTQLYENVWHGSHMETFSQVSTSTIYIRIYNVGPDGLTSAYSDICIIPSMTQPQAPSIVSPVNGSKINKANSPLLLQWSHNPVDGSTQTAAKVDVSTDNWTSYTTYTVGTDQFLSRELTAYDNGTVVSWRVSTKGAADEYSPYSTASFTVYTAPTVSIDQPGNYITSLPATVSATVSDDNGINNITYTFYQNGALKYFCSGADLTEFTISQENFVMENYKEYVLTCIVYSKSGLSTSVSKTFTAAFPEPQSGMVDVDYDSESGYTTITVDIEDDPEKATPDSISLYRVIGDEEVLLAANINPGTALTDKFTPLNTRYTYKVITYVSSTGAVHVETIEGYFESPYFYFYWDNETKVARARWDATETISWKQPSKVRVYYAGRTFPVSYNNANREETRSFTALLTTQEELDSFQEFWLSGGTGLYKSGDGSVFYADSDIDFTHLYKQYAKGTISVSLTRIDGQVK